MSCLLSQSIVSQWVVFQSTPPLYLLRMFACIYERLKLDFHLTRESAFMVSFQGFILQVYFHHNLHPSIVLFALTMDRESVDGFPVNSSTVPVEQSNPPACRKAQSSSYSGTGGGFTSSYWIDRPSSSESREAISGADRVASGGPVTSNTSLPLPGESSFSKSTATTWPMSWQCTQFTFDSFPSGLRKQFSFRRDSASYVRKFELKEVGRIEVRGRPAA